MSITKLSPNWACQMGPIHFIIFCCLGRSLHAEALQATSSEGLAQGPYVAARAEFEPATLPSKGIDSTNTPPRCCRGVRRIDVIAARKASDGPVEQTVLGSPIPLLPRMHWSTGVGHRRSTLSRHCHHRKTGSAHIGLVSHAEISTVIGLHPRYVPKHQQSWPIIGLH